MPVIPANALVALAAAVTWGGGDFSGGMAVKAVGGSLRGALRIIILAHLASLAVLLAVCASRHISLPHGSTLAWGLGAGVAAGLSITAFYLALGRGVMGASAAISGLLAAAIPVAVSVVLEGAPGWIKACGFVLALLAIWLIAAEPASVPNVPSQNSTLGLALIGGVGFGVYFVGLERANVLGSIQPMVLSRIGSTVTCLVLLGTLHKSAGDAGMSLSKTALLWTLGIAILDTAGNLFFVTATRLGRLDVAAVLASLYPAATILLAAWLLRERPSRKRGLGMLLALAAVVLITL